MLSSRFFTVPYMISAVTFLILALIKMMKQVHLFIKEDSENSEKNLAKKSTKNLLGVLLIFPLLGLSGCSACEVRVRVSPYFGGSISYLNPGKLGEYSYGRGKVGMLYTCKAGFIDTGHLFESVDRTKYAFGILLENMKNGNKEFSFNMIEPARYFVKVEYPRNWESLSEIEKEEASRGISIDLAQHIAYVSTVWHEIITWYGYSSVGLFSEKPSAFSWEDLYSDLLGSRISGQALRGGEDFNEAVTKILNKELEHLDVQPIGIAKQATKKINGRWFSGIFYPMITMKKRHFGTGLKEGSLTPWLVPGICKNQKPELCPVLDFNSISRNGFSLVLELEPGSGQGKKVSKIIYGTRTGRLQPNVHFPKITEHITRQAIKEKGPGVNRPTL